MAVKRKASEIEAAPTKEPKKVQTVAPSSIQSAFRHDLFESSTFQTFQSYYAQSGPYPHAVVPALIDDTVLRNVRSEITENIHFTLKETDIYRIHQSGDLANLSKLDQESLAHLPNLVRLRDALYSHDFRKWVASVTGAGNLSGEKTDMAVNVYTPGSYLLCHDDVIGSRRVSYILYLTDPDKPWKAEWGGGLRLYPTEIRKNAAGEVIKVPLAEHTLNIPPSFGQLSFFAVVPGESYHDVEEVFHANSQKEDRDRIRMAISGWYHIPQEGEEGYEAGLEQALAQKSSLTQLKSAANEFDEPQTKFRHYDESRTVMNSSATKTEVDPSDHDDAEDDLLTEQDLTFLLEFMSASFLAPDMVEKVSESFEETSMLQLDEFLCKKFATELKKYVTNVEGGKSSPALADDPSKWSIARPPHKHRYAYMQEDIGLSDHSSPMTRLLIDLLHSHAFKKWLALVTGLKTRSLTRQAAIARRFRRGADYALASPYQGEQPQLEFTISLTPSMGWDTDETVDGNATNGHTDTSTDGTQVTMGGQIEFGGEEIYMGGDDDDDSIHSKSLPHVGRKADPAVYKAADDDEAGILFANTPTWNQFSVVLRDKGTLRFVKYVSEAAKGDRWDIKGEVELSDDAFEGEEEDLLSDAEKQGLQFEEEEENSVDSNDGDD